MVYNREGHNEKKTEEIFYSIKYYYMDMPAVTVSTRKSAKVKQSRYTSVSDLPNVVLLPALTQIVQLPALYPH